MRQLPFDSYASVDFETFYSKEYTLRSQDLTMTDYVRDERFEAMTCAVMLDSWSEPQVAFGHDQIRELLFEIDWTRTAFLAHHAQFDGLIASHHFDVHPVFYLDTLSMARCLFGVDELVSLEAVAQRLGLPGKQKSEILERCKGKRLHELTDEEAETMGLYNEGDSIATMRIYDKLRKFFPHDELFIVDATIRMYAEPVLELNAELLAEVHATEVAKRAQAMERSGATAEILGSSEKFADLLRSLGVVPPTKISTRTGKQAYAFAKNDLGLKALADHPDERVRFAVEARLRTKSALIEGRSARLLRRVGLPTPVYLGYWAARTGRWGGGDKVNLQNLPRRGDGAGLRRALTAPAGHMIVVSDASQIEARLLAWSAGQTDKLAIFARDEDVYSYAATGIYNFDVNADDHPDERFVGKVFELGAGYGAGAAKIHHMFVSGQFGKVVNMTLEEVKAHLNAWRATNYMIVQYWRRCMDNATQAFIHGRPAPDGPITFELVGKHGYIHLPNGTFIKYPFVRYDEHERSMVYSSRNGVVRLYGGLIAENITQALARVVLAGHMLDMFDQIPTWRLATTTHDEVVGVVRSDIAPTVCVQVKNIMSIAPAWAPGLPLNAKAEYSEVYAKT